MAPERSTILKFASSYGRRATVTLDLSEDDVDHARETLEMALGELWGDSVCSVDDDEETDE